MRSTILACLVLSGTAGACPLCILEEAEHARPPGAIDLLPAGMQPGRPDLSPIDWRAEEAGMLSDHVMLTDPERFSRAGEAYFNPALTHVIFQATERPAPGEEASPHYAMYVAKLIKDAGGAITGIEEPVQVSKEGSANTCGFFHPAIPGAIIFGSTLTPPAEEQQAGYQRSDSRYAWAFPKEMEVCASLIEMDLAGDDALAFIREVVGTDLEGGLLTINDITIDYTLNATPAELCQPLFERPGGYDAECAFSPDGRHIVFSSIDPDTGDADLWVWDASTRTETRVVEADGYDGGPFFSADGQRILYRSDRMGNDLLQLYVADLVFDDTGAVTGISAEYQLTDNEHVNWGPYMHPSGEHIVYATSEVGHWNYEVFSIEVPPMGTRGEEGGTVVARGEDGAGGLFDGRLAKKRITHAQGFDGLPVFSNDGSYLIWTSQRGPKVAGEERPSSQVWVARVIDTAP
ncbi:MAG: hypothetical protein Tsb0013_04510 [Phycisphaerales bacterium]